MKNFTPFLLLGFIVWIIIHNQLTAYLRLATTLNWNIMPPKILQATGASATGASAISSAFGAGNIMGDIFDALPQALKL